MLDTHPSVRLVTHETHRCILASPLPDALRETVRRHIGDELLAADFLYALQSILTYSAEMPGSPFEVDVDVRCSPDAIEVGFQVGETREVLVRTLS